MRPPQGRPAGDAAEVARQGMAERAPTRVVVASELRLLRDGLADALARRTRALVVATCADAVGALRAVRERAPDVLLLDMALPDSLALVRAASGHPAPPQVVAFAVTEDDGELVACIEAGVAGYIARDGTVDDVVAAIERVGRGETLCSPRLAASLFRRLAALERERRTPPGFPAGGASGASSGASSGGVAGVVGGGTLPGDAGVPASVGSAPLTPREREILALIERGLANKEIAARLGIEVATVKNHVHRILEKLRVARRGQAAARARG